MSSFDCLWPAAPLALSLPPDHVHLWCVPLDVSPGEVEELLTTLSPDEKQRAGRFRLERLRTRFVAGRGQLRRILGRYLRVRPGELGFQYGPRGKPALAPSWDGSGLRFNLSNSQGLALVAVAGDREVGVDLEWIRPVANLHGLIERCFSTDEQREWGEVPEAEQLRAFFQGWTRKEAWLKVTGEGLAFPLEQVRVSLAPGQPARMISIRKRFRRGRAVATG